MSKQVVNNRKRPEGVERKSSERSGACFVCPKCHAKSYNMKDIAHAYCARCGEFFS